MEISQSLENAEEKFDEGIDCKFRIFLSIRKFWNFEIMYFGNFGIEEILEFRKY